ncbi:diguanylate cyclase [Rhizobium sp. 2YAF20]|uniref:diguanylate cyclase domain-containing protein n=1 Tax=Rhizobium sp. 2YAF20 TaxID=3233027 RepID=UPI003F998751
MRLVYSGLRVWDLRHEVAHRSAAQQSAAWITTHDSLTALFNWRSFEERTVSNAACVSRAFLAVFSIYIDDFKQINDVAACDFVYS